MIRVICGAAYNEQLTGFLLLSMAVALSPMAAWGQQAEEFKPPDGYHLVAEDNCGTKDQTHVVVGTQWMYPPTMVEASGEYRAIVFDNHACVLRYSTPNPRASYKVDVVYIDNGGRVQRLEAGGHVVHGDLQLPVKRPGRFLHDIPKAAYADGKTLELRFIRIAGANAVVSYVRVWSTDKKPLAAPPPEERAAYEPTRVPVKRPPRGAPLPLWTFDEPIERDWAAADALFRQPTGDRQWQDPCAVVEESVVACVEKHLRRGAMILADVRGRGADVAAHEKALQDAAEARDALLGAGDFDEAAWKQVYLTTRWATRRMAFEHPLLHSEGLLLVRRHHAHASHQCSRRRARYNGHGGEICILKEIRADGSGELVSLTAGKFPPGVFGRPDLSFDGRRIVFGFAATDVKDLDEEPYVANGQNSIGNGSFYQLWEMELFGNSPPRKITRGKSRREESADPIYLPDGRIAFMSPRAGGMVMCGDWAWADCMFSIEPDGSDLRQITRAKEGEWDPCLMDDGSITFTRWEYMMRFWRPTQLIWNVRPDGTNPRIIGGYLTAERNYARCRQIPGTNKVVCVESHHHNDGSGNILVVDLRHGRDTTDGHRLIVSGSADCPYPLSENYFLISYDPQGVGAADQRRVKEPTGIYLADAHGGLELVYRDSDLSAMYPTPIHPRRRPPLIPAVRPGDQGEFGEFVLQDVSKGLPESMQGKARYVRVVEAHERHIHTSPCNLWVGMGGFETKTVLGTVPVEADGSAYFRVPANRAVFFSVLDENYRALHTMRMTTNVKPGETAGCIGCHEPMTAGPPVREMPSALRRPPSEIKPPPWGLQTVGFPKLIQPVLDEHCVKCHDASRGERKSFDLRAGAEEPQFFEPNVWTIYAEGYKKYYKYQSYWTLLPYAEHADIYQYHTPPGTWGSRVSPLTKLLAEGHYDVKLSEAQWRTLCAWIDCNVPYLDDYRKFAVDPKIREASQRRADPVDPKSNERISGQ